MDPVVKSIGRLQKRFPITFPKNPAPKLPLKIGIFEDLVAHSKELSLSEAELRDAIKTWCRGSRYWKCLVEGAARVDLSGVEAGKVTAQEAAGAQRLQAHRAGKGAPKAAGAPAAEAPVTVAAAEAPGAQAPVAAASAEAPVAAASAEAPVAAASAEAPVAAASAEAAVAAASAEAPVAAASAEAPVAAASADVPLTTASAEPPTTAAAPVPEAEEADADSTAPGESATRHQASPTEPSADNAAVVQPPAAPTAPAAPSA